MMALNDDRIRKFFEQSNRVEFESLPNSIINGRVSLPVDTNIDQNALFENLTAYEIPGYVRPKADKIDLPNPGIPYVIISAKLGNKVKGIVKSRKALTSGQKSGKLSLKLSIDVTVSDRIVNIMVFPNMIKVSGGNCHRHLSEAFIFFRALLLSVYKSGVPVFKSPPVATGIHVDMVNIPFELGYRVDKQLMMECFREDKLANMPPEKEELQICYLMDIKKANGDQRYYTFRVRTSGKIMFTGDSRENMKRWYEHFMSRVEASESKFRLI